MKTVNEILSEIEEQLKAKSNRPITLSIDNAKKLFEELNGYQTLREEIDALYASENSDLCGIGEVVAIHFGYM